ncbi:MAG: hypothetical protein A2Z02_04705 [Chloroflexi bacterium RBG_16_48_7]|nr:MAG: hypothetical protein A2Z02_04705 [Chloroflexi bacterium RBG_16_48_7]
MSGNSTSDQLIRWEKVVALIPIAAALGYLNSYLREMSFCSVYGIPLEFVAITTITILKAFSSVFLLLVGVLWLLGLALMAKDLKGNWALIWTRFVSLLAVIIGGILFGLVYPPIEWLIISILSAILAIYLFFVPWIRYDKALCYFQKLAKQDESAANPSAISAWFTKYVGKSGVIFILIIILMLWASLWGGKAEAETQSDYYVLSTDNNSIVLRIYADRLICATKVSDEKKINREYFIIGLTDQTSPKLKYTNTGHLALKQ